MNIPALSTEQMVEVDRLMTMKYSIELIQMMENAGTNLAKLAGQMLGDFALRTIGMCAVWTGEQRWRWDGGCPPSA